MIDVSAWGTEQGPRPLDVVRHVMFAGLAELGWFAFLGLLAPLSLGGLLAGLGRSARAIAIVLAGLALTIVVRVCELGAAPSVGHLVLPLAAYVAGAWIGAAWLRGPRALAWLVPQCAGLIFVLAAGAAWLGWRALASDPLPFPPMPVSDSERRHLAQVIRANRSQQGELRQIRLTEEEVDELLMLVLSRGSDARKAQIVFHDGSADLDVSLRLPSGGQRYLNVQTSGRAQIEDGELRFSLDRARIGRLTIPSFVLRLVGPSLASALHADRDLGLVITSIESLRLEAGAIETVFKPGEFSTTVVPAMARRIAGKPDVLSETQDQVRELVAAAPALPRGEERFGAFVRQAFRLARDRSDGGDPALENRAAILALAILLGHERIEPLVGRVMDDSLREQAKGTVGIVTLRERADWTKHFLVSAALALLSNERIGDQIGVIKEAVDAESGGSGFSFADMAANRAGTRFALAATRDEGSARAMQDRLAASFKIDDVFPPAADLPEGLSAAELRTKYGGMNGPGYRQVEQEIDRRLGECAALK
ncbi:MAG: hypothetical protein HYX69_20720 [Planctomycetia bacterium]|nr:hypothetical protein [Planctomycetia bacterium]